MEKPNPLYTFFILAGVMFSTSSFATSAPVSKYEILKDKYLNQTDNRIGTRRMQRILEGNYLGRCYLENSDVSHGAILTTRKSVTTSVANSSEGPLFPRSELQTTTWKMALIALESVSHIEINGQQLTDDTVTESPAEQNDTMSSDQIDEYWRVNDSQVPSLNISNGVATSGQSYEVKKSLDGQLFYAKASVNDPARPVLFCYFYQKL
jgi:type II secretory pathway component PulJ